MGCPAKSQERHQTETCCGDEQDGDDGAAVVDAEHAAPGRAPGDGHAAGAGDGHPGPPGVRALHGRAAAVAPGPNPTSPGAVPPISILISYRSPRGFLKLFVLAPRLAYPAT